MEFVPNKLYYKIREACEIVGVEAHVLRFWETEFPSLTPPKSKSGQRTYRPKDIELLLRIRKLLYEEGYTIAGARKQLSARGSAAAQAPSLAPARSQDGGLKKRAGRKAPAVASPATAELAPQIEDWISSVADAVELGTDKQPEAEIPTLQEKPVASADRSRVISSGSEPETAKPTSERLKRVQAELENILTLLDRE